MYVCMEKPQPAQRGKQRLLLIVIFREFRRKMESVVSAVWVLIRFKESWHQKQPAHPSSTEQEGSLEMAAFRGTL